MSDAAQLYQKLLTDAIRKQMVILGPQITLTKTRNVPGLTVSEDGTVASLGSNPEETVTRFLEEFRELSAPLVRKTMQPLLSALGTTQQGLAKPEGAQPGIPTPPTSENSMKLPETENTNQEGLVPKT